MTFTFALPSLLPRPLPLPGMAPPRRVAATSRFPVSAAAPRVEAPVPSPPAPPSPSPLPTPSPTPPPAYVPAGRDPVLVPILMYHYVRNADPGDALGWDLSVSPQDFAAQMDWLQSSGYHPIDFNDLRAYFAGGTLPAKPVVLTFDDGYLDFYTAAYPVLVAHHFKAVSYVISGYLNSGRNLTTPQVVEMSNNGIEIAAHTVSHPDLTTLSLPELVFQVQSSKQTLESVIGKPVLDFCYPAGRYDDAVVAAAVQAGFQTATTTNPGDSLSWSNRMTWPRVRVHGAEPLDVYAANLAQTEPTVG